MPRLISNWHKSGGRARLVVSICWVVRVRISNVPLGQHQASSVLAESLRTLALRLLRHLSGPQGLAPLHAPRIFVDQVADAAFCGGSIGFTVVEGMHARHVRHGVKGAMNMTALAILRDDLVPVCSG